jgi:hypothetical protein
MVTWERLAEQGNNIYLPADFEKAAYQMVVEQVLYETDRLSKVSYALILKHQTHYRELFARLGLSLTHNAFHAYLAVIPAHHVAEKMRLAETRMALVLRRLYDDKMRGADVTDGEAYITLEELERAFRELLKRELPEKGDVRELALAMKRYGIARIEETEDVQRFQIVVRPGITDVLGESALHQLAAHAPDTDEEGTDEVA